MSKSIIKRLFFNPKLFIIPIIGNKMFSWISDERFLKIMYYCRMGNILNLKNPATFNEKLQWLKIYDHKPKYTTLADKFAVRKYITDTIGEEYLVPILGVYDNFDDINFDALPNKFVLKCTHDSGGVVICNNKQSFNIDEARKKINKCLKTNFYYLGREQLYKNIKPRIVCEQFMENTTGDELLDYKVMCFNGKSKCLFICSNRSSKDGLKVDFYDMNWKIMPFDRHYPRSGRQLEKPVNYNKMIQLSEKMAKDLPFVRVDFYEVDGRLYFGELTFYPGSGFEKFEPSKYDYKLGEWLMLPSH